MANWPKYRWWAIAMVAIAGTVLAWYGGSPTIAAALLIGVLRFVWLPRVRRRRQPEYRPYRCMKSSV